MRKAIHWLDEYLEEFLMISLLIAMTVIMGIQVFSRYIIGVSFSWTEEIIKTAADIAKEYAREQSDERVESRRKIIEESGTTIITLDEPLHETISELCKPIYDSIEETVSEDIMKAYVGDSLK